MYIYYIYYIHIYMHIYICMCVCVCVCVLTINGGWGGCFESYSFASIQHCNTIMLEARKTLYLKKTPAELLKTDLRDNGNIYFVVM